MPSYTLEIEAFGVYATNAPSLEIWEDGVLDSTHTILSTGTSISVIINYPGTLPTSLALTFNDGFAAAGRTIEIQSVKINDKYVNVGNYLSADSLTKGSSATVDITSSDFIFDASEPAASEFTTGATRTLTAGNDTVREYNGTTDEIFDALAGRDVIMTGSGNDKINGNDGNDIIRAGAGNDLIYGEDDNDRLHGQDGNDTIYGGNGNDSLYGENDDDELHGGAGNDRIHGHSGDDVMTGGTGNDTLTGGTGTNFMFGDEGDDRLIGGSGVDTMDGGDDDDLLYGGGGADIMDGGDGTDILIGNDGDDVMNGNDGDDTLHGLDDDDELNGGAGADTIYGGSGADTSDGGAGDDIIIGNIGQSVTIDATTVLSYGGASQDRNPQTITYFPGGFTMDGNPWKKVQVDYTVTANTIIEFDFRSTFEGEVHSIGFDNDDTIDASVSFKVYGTQSWGNATFDNYDGSGEWNHYRIDVGSFYTGTFSHLFFSNDDDAAPYGNGSWANVIIYESAAAEIDTLDGGADDDQIYGQDGNDVINGGSGDDILNGGVGNDTLDGDAGDDILHGGAGTDILTGDEGSDELYGGDDNDTLYALDTVTTNDADRAETNTLYGGEGDDTLYGSTGTDTLNGGDDEDTLRSYSTAGVSGTVNLVISSSSDDAEEFISTGNMESLTSSDLEMVNENSGDQIVGMRWQNLNIAQGATITNAYIEFQADEADSSTITLTFHAEDTDSAATFSTANSDISSRTTTTNSVDWVNAPSWSTGTFYQTPDLSSIIQEVVDRGGWTSGTSDLAIIVSGTAGAARVAESFDGNGAPPRLIVEYTESLSSTTVLNGDDGNDTLYGGEGTDTLNGGDGDDELRSGSIGITANVESTISSSADDAEERVSNGNVNLTSTDIEMIRDGGNDQIVGLRWQNLNIDQGVRITNAYIEFQADESDSAASNLTFHGEDVDSAAAFTSTNSDISSRTTTTNSVSWNSIPSWTTGNFYQTPDLSSVIQEIVDRGGWTSGTSDLAIIVSGIAGSVRVSESFDGNGTPARLVIEYTDPNSDVTILNGQDGQDDLYGSAGIDHFMFESASAFNDIDTITGFDVNDYDALDISDVLVGYTAGVDDITDWVRITDDGTDSTLAIDANGTTGGSSYSDVATILGVTGLTDEAALETAGNIIA